jgi:hypothetical protein
VDHNNLMHRIDDDKCLREAMDKLYFRHQECNQVDSNAYFCLLQRSVDSKELIQGHTHDD